MNHCPEGHLSAADDYCDVCGTPMTGAPASAPAPGAGAGAVPGSGNGGAGSVPGGGSPADPLEPAKTQACPHCAAPNAEDNLFCEVCGFDFTTGVMPRVEGGEPSFLDLPSVPSPADGGLLTPPDIPATPPERSEPEAGQDARVGQATPSPDPTPPAVPGRGSEGGSVGSAHHAAEADAAPDPAPSPAVGEADRAGTPDAAADVAGAADARSPRGHTDPAGAGSPARPGPKPVNRPPSREVAGDWVVEVWIDPDWFAEQDTDETCPSPAPPEIVRLTGSDALIGRRSRTSVPDIDCGVDSAVSRRQALLTSDGRRWWIEDLDSSNGTWVAPAVGPLPSSPITGRTEVDADDRIYVGAWTRLVVRAAVESELR